MERRVVIQALLSALIAALLIAACSQATPTVDPLIFTQTAAAQATSDAASLAVRQTAEAKFNQQPTVTETPTTAPTRTASPVPSNTPTIFLSATPTATLPPTPSATLTPLPYQCVLVDQTPRDGTTAKIDTNVTVRWTIKNLGPATWEAKYIDLLQMGGDKIAEESRLDLPKNVKPGEEVELSVLLKFKDRTGIYRTDWALTVTDSAITFCPLYVEIWLSN